MKIAFLLLLTSIAFGASLRLENDSIYPLKAVIQGADGTVLGEVTIPSQEVKMWDDTFPVPRHASNPNKSLTPLTVHWYCPEGTNFSTVEQVSTGSLVKARGGIGSKTCAPKKQEDK